MDIIPIFSSEHSISSSILTVDTFKEEKGKSIVPDDAPVSIFAIAKQHKLELPLIVDSDISGFWKIYKNAKELEQKYVYGLKLTVCADLNDKSPESEKTESNVIILFKNSRAYYDMVPLYSLASTVGMVKTGRRLDWKTLHQYWTENFQLCIPFYSSFLARNLLRYNHTALPDFGKLSPTFFIQQQGLPFDEMLRNATTAYCKQNKFSTQEAVQCYYYRNSDIMSYLTYKCITLPSTGGRRATWDCPNIEHFCSDQFSFEHYLKLTGRPKELEIPENELAGAV